MGIYLNLINNTKVTIDNSTINSNVYAGGNGAKTEEVIMMVENGFIKLFSPEKCELCGTCQMFCPVNAIWLE